MITDQEYEEELQEMEEEERQYLEHVLELALAEEPWERAAAFRRRLRRIRALGVFRDTIKAKVREHGFSDSPKEFC